MNSPEFAEVSDALEHLELAVSAAEVHGRLCAVLCRQSSVSRKQWLEILSPDALASVAVDQEGSLQVMVELLQATQQSFQSMEFGLQLLLPDDAEPLHERIPALGEWIQGFLAELNAHGLLRDLPEDMQEAIADLLKIACLEYDAEDESTDEDEASYVELVECTRLTVEFLRDYLAQDAKIVVSTLKRNSGLSLSPQAGNRGYGAA